MTHDRCRRTLRIVVELTTGPARAREDPVETGDDVRNVSHTAQAGAVNAAILYLIC